MPRRGEACFPPTVAVRRRRPSHPPTFDHLVKAGLIEQMGGLITATSS